MVLPGLVALGLVTVWELAVRWSRSDLFPGPWAVALGIGELARKGPLAKYVIAAGECTEAQYHGGLRVENIRDVQLPGTEADARAAFPELIRDLESRGIPWRPAISNTQ